MEEVFQIMHTYVSLLLCREELSEQDEFPERALASLVASKVYYHLGSFQDSLTYALGAGSKFNVNGRSEYIETMLCELALVMVGSKYKRKTYSFNCGLCNC